MSKQRQEGAKSGIQADQQGLKDGSELCVSGQSLCENKGFQSPRIGNTYEGLCLNGGESRSRLSSLLSSLGQEKEVIFIVRMDLLHVEKEK